MEKGLSLWYAQKKMCDPICSNINFQIRHFSLCIHTRLHRKTNKSLIPWNKLTFPLPTASEKKQRGKQNWECKGDLFNFSFLSEASCSLLSRFLFLLSLFMKNAFCHCLRHTQWIGEKEGNLLPIFIFMLHKNSFLLLFPFHFRFSAFVSLFSCSFSFLTF